MIDIGTSTHAIAGFGAPSKPFAQAVAEIAECGFQHFLLLGSAGGPSVDAAGQAPAALVDILGSDRRAILRLVSAHGLRVGAIYPGIPMDFSAAGATGTVRALRQFREAAWEVGCHTIVHPAGAAERPRMPHEDKQEAIARVGEVMDAIASDTPGDVLKMAVDVHYGGIIETVADCEYLLATARKRNTGLCLNTGHMTTLGEPGWTLLSRYPERVHVLAWKDHLVGDDLPQPVVSCELGQGATPFARYADALRGVECAALNLITFEHVPFEEKKPALARSRAHLAGLLSGAHA